MKILDAFNDIERLELKISELYIYFKGLFSDDPEASAIFDKLRNDEKSHWDLVKYQRRIVRQNQKMFADVDVNIKEVRAIISYAENIIKKIPPPSLHEAVQIAIDFESSAAEAHYHTAMEQSNKEFSDFLRNLVTLDKEHLGLLREFAKSRGFSNR